MKQSFAAQKSLVPAVIFLVYALLAYAAALILLQAIPESESHRALLASVMLPLDLMLGLPALFYFLVIRRYKLAPALLIPVVALGALFVLNVAKPDNITAVLVIGAVALLVELSIGIVEFRRIGRIFLKAKQASDDPREWFFAPVYELVRNKKAATLLTLELTTIYYALFSWRSKPLVPQGAQAFTYHKESAYINVMTFFVFFSPVEIAVLHFMIALWNPAVAWVVTMLTLVSLLWLWGDVRATKLRPLTVSNTTLNLSMGIKLTACIPLALVELAGSKDPELSKAETLDMSGFDSANTWITFKAPVEVEMLFGLKKKVRAIALTVDSAPKFHKALLSE